MTDLDSAKEKISSGSRLNRAEILALYEDNDLLYLGESARRMKERKTGKQVFYTVNRHINLTNVCSANCPLCAFQCHSGDNRAFTLDLNDVEKILRESAQIKDLSEIHIVSSLHPDKDFDYYVDAVKLVKKILPDVGINAFTPVEIINFAKISGKTVDEILRTLINVGVTSLAGGGAEILSNRVREIICPKKCTADEWLDVMRTAHGLGLRTNASMMFGHIETIEERIDHLLKLRDLQDETGGFVAMMLFPFHPDNTELGKRFNLRRVGSWEDLKMLALSRLVLDNFDHFKAFWVMLTLPIAQLALNFGADDMDGTIGEEKIIHAAGAKNSTGITREKLRAIISEISYTPVERDSFYNKKFSSSQS
ncbi:MAG: CofH family radical SAM protein [Selenomonadaceae bacterium]|nr:CofH family radical SAM protein [Selenomonadaceae bacterium]